MRNVMSIGTPPWTRSEMLDRLDEFESIYADRPIKDNQGGMKAPHMFAVWFMAKHLAPDLIVESGVWKGQSTWLLERACPTATLVSIDVNLRNRQYISDRVVYFERDFVEQDWSEVTDRSLAFFDDHQNAYRRLQQCKWFGFKHTIFEDNYPITRGDCYSLKKAFANAGFELAPSQQKSLSKNLFSKALRRFTRLIGLTPTALTPQDEAMKIYPNDIDSSMLQKHLEVYYEFPPVYKTSKTRWGDDWNDVSYPTSEPLFAQPTKSTHRIFVDEAIWYTWICYAKLK